MKCRFFCPIVLAVATLVSMLTSIPAFALPASARLFQQVYGYKTSCLLCHATGGGSAPNGYGKAFLRAGANSGAFKKIEAMDSDGDGISNIKEILAKSNPGDKQSTPTDAGDWLASANSVFIPQKQLEKLFPEYSKFSAIEGALNATQVEFVKAKVGHDVYDDDKVPTFYFAEKDGKRVAVAQLISEQRDGKGLSSGIAVGTNGKIIRVSILGGSFADAAALEKNYLDSVLAKSLTDLPASPNSEAAVFLRSSIERSLVLMQAVFGGAK